MNRLTEGFARASNSSSLPVSAFKDYISYVPERVYMDKEGKVRVFDEMWTGDWWWEIQVRLFKRFF